MFCTFGAFLDTTSCCCTIMYEINNIIIISPYCHFGMNDQGLPATRLTCTAYVDGKKRYNISF